MKEIDIKFYNKKKNIYESETCDFMVDSSLNVISENPDYGTHIEENHEPHFYIGDKRIG